MTTCSLYIQTELLRGRQVFDSNAHACYSNAHAVCLAYALALEDSADMMDQEWNSTTLFYL